MGLWFLIAAFMLRAFIPAGMMPELTAGDQASAMTLVLCSGAVPNAEALREMGLPVHRETSKEHGASCPFAGMGALGLQAPAGPVLTVVWSLMLERLMPVMARPAPSRRLTSVSARGPPSLSDVP